MTPDEALQRAAEHFRSGRFGEAARSAQELLAHHPENLDALSLLAAAAENDGDLEEADRALSALIGLAPHAADAFDSLIRVSHRRGDFRRLADSLLGRLSLAPDRWELWNDLGAALERLGTTRDADVAYRRAAIVAPGMDRPLLNRSAMAFRQDDCRVAYRLAKRAQAVTTAPGEALLIAAHSAQSLGMPAAAGISYRRLLALAPAEPSAWQGVSAIASTSPEDQQLLLRKRAYLLAPGDPTAMAGMAEGSRIAGDPGASRTWARKALSLAPHLAAGHNALNNACSDLDFDAEALLSARRAAWLAPARTELLVNLGIAEKAVGHLKEAEAAVRTALRRSPDDPAAHLSLATTLMIGGHLREGLAEFEWRNARGTYYDLLPAPKWDGRPLAKGSLLVWGDQGVGDQIMFSQYVAEALKRAPSMVIECDPRLASILQRTYPHIRVVPHRPEPPRDRFGGGLAAQIAMCSLPHALGLDAASLQSRGPYLVPDPARLAANAERIRGLGEGLKVGIAWRSLKDTPYLRRHHTRLTDWGPILRTPGIRFVNLQYGDRNAEIGEAQSLFGIDIAQFRDIDMFNDLEELLALSSQVDLVLSTATTAYMLAAAAGIEIWLLFSRLNYRLFGADRDYLCPRSRAFVRMPGETWDPAIDALARALAERLRPR
jgi:Flp pilus assembly protein TadD